MAMGVEADVPMSPSCDGCPCVPPKLDLVLRRLRWLGAPKVPWIRYIFFGHPMFGPKYIIFLRFVPVQLNIILSMFVA